MTISQFSYNATTKKLSVTRGGQTFIYLDVRQSTFNKLSKSSNLTQFYVHKISKKFCCVRQNKHYKPEYSGFLIMKIRFEPPVGTETLEQTEQVFRRLFAGSETQHRSGTRYISGSAIEYQLRYHHKQSRASECLELVSDAPDIVHIKDGKHITIQERESIYNSFSHDVHKRRCDECGTDRSDFNVEWYEVDDRSINDWLSVCYICVKKFL